MQTDSSRDPGRLPFRWLSLQCSTVHKSEVHTCLQEKAPAHVMEPYSPACRSFVGQLGPEQGTHVQCTIVRDKSSKMYPKYTLMLDGENRWAESLLLPCHPFIRDYASHPGR